MSMLLPLSLKCNDIFSSQLKNIVWTPLEHQSIKSNQPIDLYTALNVFCRTDIPKVNKFIVHHWEHQKGKCHSGKVETDKCQRNWVTDFNWQFVSAFHFTFRPTLPTVPRNEVNQKQCNQCTWMHHWRMYCGFYTESKSIWGCEKMCCEFEDFTQWKNFNLMIDWKL